MRIAIATCRKKPEGTNDDQLLTQALQNKGHEARNVLWNDPQTDWSKYDLCLLRSPWDYYERLPEFLHWAEQTDKKTKLVNPLATVRVNAEKDYLLSLEKLGLPVVSSFIFASREDALQKAHDLLRNQPVVVKPTVSGGSYLTYVVKNEAELMPAVSRVLAHGKLLLQPYLPTIETQGEVSLMYFRVRGEWRYSHAVLKTARKGEFRVQTDFGGKVEIFQPSPRVNVLAERILATLHPLDLYVRIDLVDWQTEPKIGELELIEPALFFAQSPKAAPLLVEALEAI